MDFLSRLLGKKDPPALALSFEEEFEVRCKRVGEGVTECATELARGLLDKELSGINSDEAVAECMLALLHFVDKQAFSVVGPDGRSLVMDAVRPKALSAILRVRYKNEDVAPSELRQVYIEHVVVDRYDERMDEYTPLALVPQPNDRGGFAITKSLGFALGKHIDPEGEMAAIMLSAGIFECFEPLLVKYGLRELLELLKSRR